MRIMTILAMSALATAPLQAAPLRTPIRNAAGAAIGEVTLTDAPKGVLIHVEASGLTPGWHAVHFHEKGDCSDAAFKLSGGHVHGASPTVHGLLNPLANDMGDLPNLFAGADGKANAEIFAAMVALGNGSGRANLRDADGSALVIHARADDYQTQPIGGAGDRVACAVIR